MTDVFFNFPALYDSGVTPDISVSNGTVVEVHQSQGGTTLWYHVGLLTGDLVSFGPSYNYDSGVTPSVALNSSGTVVEVHKSQGNSGLWYHVGTVDPGNETINLGGSNQYDDGQTPSIAMNDQNVVIEVHQSQGNAGLWCHVGVVNPSGQVIDFSGSSQYDQGTTPSIAINNSNVVVEVHKSQGNAGLWYHVGVVDPNNKTVSFGSSVNYDSGANPSVALTDDGFVIETHQSQSYNTLWKRIGQVDVDSKTINWITGSVQYADGSLPSVTTDGTMAIQANQSSNSLYCAASMVIDRNNWMADNLALLGNKTLLEIAMPGSHDAGMTMTQDCRMAQKCNTQTQNQTILGQLQVGSRYFDIRPVVYNGAMYTGHYSVEKVLGTLGCNGQSMADVLSEVVNYIQTGKDLVILKFSHYFNRDTSGGFSDTDMQNLVNQVTSALDPWLYKGDVPSGGLQSLTVNDYIGSGNGKVLIVFDDLSDTLHNPSSGIYSYLDKGKGTADLVVFDQYADSNDLDTMISNQLGELTNGENHQGNLFLLSWTLTQSNAQAVFCSSSILDLAQQADAALWGYLVSAYKQGKINPTYMTNLIYTDNVQGTQTDFAIWLNQQMLKAD